MARVFFLSQSYGIIMNQSLFDTQLKTAELQTKKKHSNHDHTCFRLSQVLVILERLWKKCYSLQIDTDMAAVSLFLDTNIAAVTSRENILSLRYILTQKAMC